MITREADYAMRLAVYLAWAQGRGRGTASCAEVSEAMDVPYRFLRKIVKRMVGTGLILSARGKGGGLRLARAPRGISLLDIVKAMGPAGVTLSRCVAEPGDCPRSARCRVHTALLSIQGTVDKRLGALTLDKLV